MDEMDVDNVENAIINPHNIDETTNAPLDCEQLLSCLSSEVANKPDNNANISLRRAVIENNVELLNSLLHQSCIDVNHKNDFGETPLVVSLKMCLDDPFIVCFIEAGCEVNTIDIIRRTPLHLAILRPTVKIAQCLLERGADVNVQDENGWTPLHLAVDRDNLEAVCMLLCYGADTSTFCENYRPLVRAIKYDRSAIAEVLINYCDDVSCKNALLYAVKIKSPIACSLVKAGANVNFCTRRNKNTLMFSLLYESSELFKLIWPRLDYDILFYRDDPFIHFYFEECRFTASEWAECLYIMLGSSVSLDLLNHYWKYFRDTYQDYFLHELMTKFYLDNVEQKDRVALLHISLSLGCQLCSEDINEMNRMFGFDKEFETLIYYADCYEEICISDNEFNYPRATFIFGLEEDSSPATTFKLFQNLICASIAMSADEEDYFVYSIRFFSLPLYAKRELMDLCREKLVFNDRVLKQLNLMSEIPSLIELSRNQTRTFIRQNFQIKTPYNFHTIINNLKVPQYIKDIIRFKRPIY